MPEQCSTRETIFFILVIWIKTTHKQQVQGHYCMVCCRTCTKTMRAVFSYVWWFIAEHVWRQGMQSFELCPMIHCRTCTKTRHAVFWVMSDGSLQNMYEDNACGLLSYVWWFIAEHIQRQGLRSFELCPMVHCRTCSKTMRAVFWVTSDVSLQNMCTKTVHAVFWVMSDGSLQNMYIQRQAMQSFESCVMVRCRAYIRTMPWAFWKWWKCVWRKRQNWFSTTTHRVQR